MPSPNIFTSTPTVSYRSVPMPANYAYSNSQQAPESQLAFQPFGQVDKATSDALQEFIATAKDGTVQLPQNLEKMLTARYKAYNFKMPEYNVNIDSVADLPDNIKEALIARAMKNVTRTSEGQRQQAKDTYLRMGRAGSGGLAAVLRDINKSEMEQAGNVSTQNMTDEANRAFEEAKTVRGLNIEDARFRSGLEDMLQTRQAAEAEKVYQSEYGRQQDIINTIMNQAAFKSGERANEASRQQAGVQQGLNYLGQASAYRQNVQQLQNKKGADMNVVGVPTTSYQSTPTPNYKSFAQTPSNSRYPQGNTSSVTPYQSYQYGG